MNLSQTLRIHEYREDDELPSYLLPLRPSELRISPSLRTAASLVTKSASFKSASHLGSAT